MDTALTIVQKQSVLQKIMMLSFSHSSPHTTHEMQPLDMAVFSSLKTHCQDVCHTYLQKYPGRLIYKHHFSGLFSEAWGKALVPLSITNGFKYTGVYPFNPQIALEKFPGTDRNDTTVLLVTENGKPSADDENVSSAEEDEGIRDFTLERFENGFHLYDPKYISWLKINHPEATLQSTFSFLPVLLELSKEGNLPPNSEDCCNGNASGHDTHLSNHIPDSSESS